MLSLSKKLDRIEPLVSAQSGEIKETVYGIVDRVDIVDGEKVPHFIRKWKGTIGNMRPTDEEPTIYCIEKLEPAIINHKKYKCFYGGRAGTKSMFAMDAMSGEVNISGCKVLCLRERMKSLKESIFAGVEGRIKDLDFGGFSSVPSNSEIRHNSGGGFSFQGMQNMTDFKSLFRYKYFLMEESARTSQHAINILGPTLRDVEGAELWWVWNPESISDPMSKEFIVPYQSELDRCGYYEDEFTMVIKVGYDDNPWFEHDTSLVTEIKKDKAKVKNGTMPKARFKHIWQGGFMDDIDNGLIKEEWFESCVDAHKKLGFEALGGTVFSFDPADTGGDAHGYAVKHGRVFTKVGEIEAENGNRATDEACGMARNNLADYFRWDCDGLGATLRDNVTKGIDGTKIDPLMFKGSESPANPDKKFIDNDHHGIKGNPTNKQSFRNKRAQGYTILARAMRLTHEAVQKSLSGMAPAIDLDDLISFDSSGMQNKDKLKSELCRLPLKPASGQICLYSKDEMRKGITMPNGDKLVIPSPNMGDSVMMTLFETPVIKVDWGDDINEDDEEWIA